MRYEFKDKNKRFYIDVRVCQTVLSKAIGLMFKKKSKPLLFVFNRPTRTAIHSFFCRPFLAIWIHDNKVVDERFVKRWRFSIKPKKEFDRLIEIPKSDGQFSVFYRRYRNL